LSKNKLQEYSLLYFLNIAVIFAFHCFMCV